MLDYDREAGRYDATRGGEARAGAAADAINTLIPLSGGQGLSPRRWRKRLRADDTGWVSAAGVERLDALCAALEALPDQDRPRADPVYQLVALRR